jgi:hypothetical protein
MESCSLAGKLHTHILFQNFRAWKDHFLIKASLTSFEKEIKNKKIFPSGPGPSQQAHDGPSAALTPHCQPGPRDSQSPLFPARIAGARAPPLLYSPRTTSPSMWPSRRRHSSTAASCIGLPPWLAQHCTV